MLGGSIGPGSRRFGSVLRTRQDFHPGTTVTGMRRGVGVAVRFQSDIVAAVTHQREDTAALRDFLRHRSGVREAKIASLKAAPP